MNDDITGVILCGGTGSRLFPVTKGLNKHLLPLFSKPMFYYPLSLLLLLGVKKIIFVCNSHEIELYREQLRFLERFDLDFKIVGQKSPGGIVEALENAMPLLDTRKLIAILGDNVFHGSGLIRTIEDGISFDCCMSIFTCSVGNPKRFGVAVRDKKGKIVEIVEKPKQPLSDEAVTGLYFIDYDFLKSNLPKIKRSVRGEREISALINNAILTNKLKCERMSRGTFWIDAGTIEDFFGATEYIRSYENRSGELLMSPEEIALKRGLINKNNFFDLVSSYPPGMYKTYLQRLGQN